MKVFFDTNVLISVFTARGLCLDLFNRVIQGHEMVTSEAVLDELHRVMRRKFDASIEQADRTVAVMRRTEVVPTSGPPFDLQVRDPDDLPILASAIASGADVLVTGDRDLLDVADASPIHILDPRGLWELMKQSR